MEIIARSISPNREVFEFKFSNNIAGLGDYALSYSKEEISDSTVGTYVSYFVGSKDHNAEENFFASESGSGIMSFTKIDTSNRIVSGTFWFDAWNKDSIKVEVREGRFDIKY